MSRRSSPSTGGRWRGRASYGWWSREAPACEIGGRGCGAAPPPDAALRASGRPTSPGT
jgi:hypothetical protein